MAKIKQLVPGFELTADNYYSTEANMAYWSASLVKSFLSCEAKAYAELTGNWEEEPSTALLVGSYVDAYFEGEKAFERFILDHPEILSSRTGELKADYKRANEMIDRCEADPVFMEYMQGTKQTIKTGMLFGVPFKAKYDVRNTKKKRIVDFKTARDLRPMYKPGEGRLTPISYWGWDVQCMIYGRLNNKKDDYKTYLAIVTKENPPDIALVEIDKGTRDALYDYIAEKMPRWEGIKHGFIEPERCEHCAFCRATRKLKKPMTIEEMEFELYTGEED